MRETGVTQEYLMRLNKSAKDFALCTGNNNQQHNYIKQGYAASMLSELLYGFS
jgi:hypothetical protein